MVWNLSQLPLLFLFVSYSICKFSTNIKKQNKKIFFFKKKEQEEENIENYQQQDNGQQFDWNQEEEIGENETSEFFKKQSNDSLLSSQVERFLNRDMIFIVGVQSSGTTLMRLLLDVHPDVNCGDETGIIFRTLDFVVKDILGSPSIVKFMSDFGVKKQTLKTAAALFIYYMMENNKKNPQVDIGRMKYICNKG